jgi:hypothetical protein
MTVNSTNSKAGPYEGNGITVDFPFSFRILDESHIRVIITAPDDTESDASPSDYVVSGVDDVEGSVKYKVGSPLATGFKLTILRSVPMTQEVDIANSGGFYPQVHEDVFDKLMMQVQQVVESDSRAVKIPASDTTTDPDALVEELRLGRDEAIAAAVATAADRVQTGLDRTQTGADRTAVHTDRVATDADAVATAADRVAVHTDRVATDADAVATAADRVQTGLDRVATAADRVQTGLDRVQTGSDKTATAADRVQTGLDRNAASASAASAAAIVAGAMFQDVVFLTFANSPYTVTQAQNGTMLAIDSSSGTVVVNLPLISGLALPFTLGIKKTSADGNPITVNRAGSDLIDGGTTKSIASPGSGSTFLPDKDPTPDAWTTADFGATAGNITPNYFVGDGVRTTDTLSVAPGSKYNTTINIGGVMQLKTSYDIVGAVLTYGSPPALGAVVEVLIGALLPIGVTADNSVSTAKLQDSSVSTAKLQDNSVSTVKLQDAAVTNAKLANMAANTVKVNATSSAAMPTDVALAASQLFGRGDSGNLAPIDLGTGMAMIGTVLSATRPPVRQTVLNASLDGGGYPILLQVAGGSGLSITTIGVSSGNPLVITAANGYTDKIGILTSNLSISLVANTTHYLFGSIQSNGSINLFLTGSVPVYQWLGTPTVVSNAYTFNIAEMKGYLGNGTTAVPTSDIVFIGEVVTNATVVTSVVNYALMGQYESPWTNTLPANASNTVANHNIGVYPKYAHMIGQCITADGDYAVLEQINLVPHKATVGDGGEYVARNTKSLRMRAANAGWSGVSAAGGDVNLTSANWKYKFIAGRGW